MFAIASLIIAISFRVFHSFKIRKKTGKFIFYNCKYCVQSFHKFEIESMGTDAFLNDLYDILKQMYFSTYSFIIKNINKKNLFEKLEMDSKDINIILFYYFDIQRKIVKNNSYQFNFFYFFTKKINEFKGKNK